MKEPPVILNKLYGKRNSYTEKQIINAMQKAGYKLIYTDYAFAIFMSKSKFAGDRSKYEILRSVVAKRYFSGNENFTIHDLLLKSSISQRKLETILDYRKVGAADIAGADYIVGGD